MQNKQNEKSDNGLSSQDWRALVTDLRHFGYLLPTDDFELERFNTASETAHASIPSHLANGEFLFQKKKNVPAMQIISEVPSVRTDKGTSRKNDYFKKIVLAAEIAYQLHEEPTFGHKKFVKVQYLCEQVCLMDLNTKYGRYAAGPLDPKLMYSIDSEFEKQNWFRAVKRDSFGFKYELLDEVEKYKKYYSNYFGNQAERIEFVIELLRKEKSDFCEAVATLFYVWKEQSNTSNTFLINESSLIKEFYLWDESKARFSENTLKQTIVWMTSHGIIPKNSN